MWICISLWIAAWIVGAFAWRALVRPTPAERRLDDEAQVAALRAWADKR